jgi:ABC-2 type transport system ATP-binding protein
VALTFEETPPDAVLALLRDPQRIARPALPSRQMELEVHERVDAQQLLADLLAAGARLERFELVRPSLHRIFLERVGASGVETGMSGHG